MQPISKAWLSHIDITNHCGKNCVYCTRYDRHLSPLKKYHMSIGEFSVAVYSYIGWPNKIGIMGGEPLLHPEFDLLCEILLLSFPKKKNVLFTAIDPERAKWRESIQETFGCIEYHPHTKDQESKWEHQPITIAISDVVKDRTLRDALIDDCWVQRKWCPTVTNDGAYFCEVAASLGKLLGTKGWPVTPEWWKTKPEDFGYQKALCQLCGMAIPMSRQSMSNKKELISPKFMKLLFNLQYPVGDYEIFDREITVREMKDALPDWKPGCYRDKQINETFQYSTIDWSRF